MTRRARVLGQISRNIPQNNIGRAASLGAFVAMSLIYSMGIAATPYIGKAPKAIPLATAGSSPPMDVISEDFEDFGKEHRAVWSGRVELIQGLSKLLTPRLTVYFHPQNAATGKTAQASGDPGKVDRMEAEGTVFYVTPTERARGDHGIYQADGDTITLTGNVVVQQGNNVATGDELIIERSTGHSTLSSLGANRRRVRAVLYPNAESGTSRSTNATSPTLPPK